MITEILSPLRPDLTSAQLAQFETYYAMLADWNTRVNLTAIITPEDVAKKHFLDSLASAPYLKEGASIADVGTGAGFPGLPLLILRPDLKVTLIDSLQKRLVFLEAVLQELKLTAECVHARAEDAGQNPRYRERFDAALTRAVSGLPVLCELTLPLVKVGGISIAYKGDSAEELAASGHALTVLQATAERVVVPSDYGARELVILTKTGTTPKQYPRKAGTPVKHPL
jgi:16S rRNA (guanine527-N7)-methyltransferase